MTNLASANARASLVLLSYSCGSALGSVTTLCTPTFEPPSCATRLPQKFSPATTLMVDDALEVVPPQAASSSPAAARHRHLPMAQEHCTSCLRKSSARTLGGDGAAQPGQRSGAHLVRGRAKASLVDRRAPRSRRAVARRRGLFDSLSCRDRDGEGRRHPAHRSGRREGPLRDGRGPPRAHPLRLLRPG